MTPVKVGTATVLAVTDGRFSRPATRFFPGVTEAQWETYRAEHLDAGGHVHLNFGSFVVRADGQTVLVDTGLGPRLNIGGTSGTLLESLGAAGVAPEDVDMVVTTHLHLDHIGWNTVEQDGAFVPAFPRARYLVQRADWDFFLKPNPAEDAELYQTTMRPLERAGVLELVEGEHAVTPSLRFLPTPGHTPGHACFLISSGGEGAVILGDVGHSPAQVPEPDWSAGADLDQPLGRQSRQMVWDRIEQEGLTVCAGHFLPPNIGRFVRVEGKRHFRAL